MKLKIGEVKEKIMNWLNEEGLSPTELLDPNCHFNFSVTVGNLVCNVLQNKRKIDSVMTGVNLVFTSGQIELLEKMGKERRQEFFWDLRLLLARSNELGDFQIKPKPPEIVHEVFISSRSIFYDALTKDRLLSTIYLVLRTGWTVVWMLERYAGSTKPKENRMPFYV